eukprot:g3200.t1
MKVKKLCRLRKLKIDQTKKFEYYSNNSVDRKKTMAALTMRSLLDYVKAKDEDPYANLAEGMVSITLTHNLLKRKMIEIRLDLHTTIANVKKKIYHHTGTAPQHQSLVLKENDQPICELSDDSRPLGFYSVKSGMEIKVVDTNPFSLAKNGGLEDTSLIQKYVMSDEAYDKKKNSVRQYKRDQLAKDPNWKPPKLPGAALGNAINARARRMVRAENREKRAPATKEDCIGIKIGDRCELLGGKRGVIAFIGEVSWVPGFWIGIRLDEPVGRNDGTGPDNKRYFECGSKCGLFKRPQDVKVGDYPEEDFDFDDSDEEEL